MVNFDSPPDRGNTKWFGLLNRRERWGLSLRGWVISILAMSLIGSALLMGAYPFLATTQRVPAEVLVVEGWVHEYAAREALTEFASGKYIKVMTTGGPVVGSGGYINDQNTSASVGAGLLRRVGVAPDVIQMVPSRVIDKDRTYHAALALRRYWETNGPPPKAINILTEGPHARRTRLLFQKALGNDVQIGIIAVPNPDYDSARWWAYSDGVKNVGAEFLGYFYARISCLLPE